MSEVESRLSALEERVDALEAAQKPLPTDTDSKIECLLAAAVNEAMDGLSKNNSCQGTD